ncbi:peptidoglycan-associated lipoprotein Pal [Usitatibacter palustris]|uniref:Peptidoglycan-associated lipoprotein n=1 Tax=Usitatibacter palustris TaxID=2732487 RepID=A0A6M4H5B2_9PROT|nr:peptidoglycan-associated lipoprotein Pal [Usitatibacter palustris]QJR14472.1 Peptidoglycan-associated lipoprotein [Usitatibacter palustris]
MMKIALSIALAGLLTACASKDTKTDTPVADRSTAVAPTTTPNTSGTTTPATNPNIAGNPLRDPSNILSKRSVFFEFDSNAVKDEYRGMVQAHSKYMADKRDSKIRIEGNCDERGSREYNIALGQRRAESVKKVMTVLGVGEARIETVSYGEEKPMSPGHDEPAWSQNRRADIKYAGE